MVAYHSGHLVNNIYKNKVIVIFKTKINYRNDTSLHIDNLSVNDYEKGVGITNVDRAHLI